MSSPAMLGAPADLSEQLARDEGTVLHAYPDSQGYWTIGTGICIDSRVGCGITAQENQYLLGNRIRLAQVELAAKFPWVEQLDPVRLGVLTNMTFNMGVERLAKFVKFLAFMQAAQWPQAAGEMLDSAWAKQVGERAGRLAKQVVLGVWQ